MTKFFQRLASEVRRRRILRALAVYAVTAWLILQVAVVVVEPMMLPAWTMKALILAAIVGFPVTLLLTWVIDTTPEGLIFDLPLLGSEEDVQRKQGKSDLIWAGLTLCLVLAGSLYLVFQLLEEMQGAANVSQEEQVGTISDNSIAVLAFENYGAEDATDYFAAGLAEEILSMLARLDELQVAARTSSFQFKDKQVDVKDVAARLQVRHILEGSARQHGQRVRVNARLVDGETGFNNWGKIFEQPVDDIFAIQQTIAQGVVDELKIALSISSSAEIEKQATDSSGAYVDYLQGVGRLRSSLDAAIMSDASEFFRKAIADDDRFSKAYAGLCEAHLRIYDALRNTADFEIAESSCNKASELDSGLDAAVLLALGKLYQYRGWFDRAEQQFDKAIALSAEPVDAYIQLGTMRSEQLRPEDAELLLLKAVEIRPQYWAAYEALASFYYRNGRYEAAAEAYEHATELGPSVATAFAGKGAAYWVLGDFDKALDSYEKSLAIRESRIAYTNVGFLYYYKGQHDLSIKNQLKALEIAPNDSRVLGKLADAYHFSGQQEQGARYTTAAITAFEKSLELNAKDWKSMALLAKYYARAGRLEDALNAAEGAVVLSKGKAEALYEQSLTLQLLGKTEQAIDSLALAVEADAYFKVVGRADPVFLPLRPNARFSSVVAPQ